MSLSNLACMQALLTVLCLSLGVQGSAPGAVQPRSWAAARQHDGVVRPAARHSVPKPSLERPQFIRDEDAYPSLPYASEPEVDQCPDPVEPQQDCAYPVALTFSHCLALLLGVLLGATVMRGVDQTLLQAQTASVAKAALCTKEVAVQVEEVLLEAPASSTAHQLLQHSKHRNAVDGTAKAGAAGQECSDDSTDPGNLAPAGCMSEDDKEVDERRAPQVSSKAQVSSNDSHAPGLQECLSPEEASASAAHPPAHIEPRQAPEPPDTSDGTAASASVLHPMHRDKPEEQQPAPSTGADSAQIPADSRSASDSPAQASHSGSTALATVPQAAGPLSVPGHTNIAEPFVFEFKFRGSAAALEQVLERYVGPTIRWVHDASQVIGHAAHALSHLSEQAPRAVQALEKVGTGVERLLHLQELRSQQAVAARCVSTGLYVMTAALVLGSFRWGRLATVAARCSIVRRTAIPDGPPLAAGWKRMIGLSWAEQMFDPWQHLWAWARRTAVGCYIHELGAWAVGAGALWQLLPLCYRLAGRRLEQTWQVDVPLLLGGVVGTGGYYLVNLLGGNNAAWLALWLLWCGTSLFMFLRTTQGWVGRAVAILFVTIVIPGLAGLMPFMHSVLH